jgi:hypothetical protein
MRGLAQFQRREDDKESCNGFSIDKNLLESIRRIMREELERAERIAAEANGSARKQSEKAPPAAPAFGARVREFICYVRRVLANMRS